jgi:hypothetical protein
MGAVPVPVLRRKASSIEALGLTGIAFAILSSTSVFLAQDTPACNADDAVVHSWLADSGNRVRVVTASYLALFASIALLWFIGAVRRRIGDREDQLFSTVFLGSGLCFVALYLAGFAAISAPVALYETGNGVTVSAGTFQMTVSLGSTLLVVMSTRMAALLMLSMSNLGRVTKAFPRWLTVASMLAGLVMLFTATFSEPMVWVFPAWSFVVGIAILGRRKSLQARDSP